MRKKSLHKYARHLSELRGRVIKCLLLFCLVFAGLFYKSQQVFELFFLQNFASFNLQLFTSKISSGFFIRLKLCIYFAIAICLPYFVYHAYQFISLGLFKRERKSFWFGCVLGCLLGYLGFAFASFYLLPLCLAFFNSMQLSIASVSNLVEIESFIALCFAIGFCGFLTFQTPIIVFLLLKFNIVSLKTFKNFRKIYIPFFLTIGAIITPPDVVSQVICATIMIIFAETGFVVFKINNKNCKKNLEPV